MQVHSFISLRHLPVNLAGQELGLSDLPIVITEAHLLQKVNGLVAGNLGRISMGWINLSKPRNLSRLLEDKKVDAQK